VFPLDAGWSAAAQFDVLTVESAIEATSASEQRIGMRIIVEFSLSVGGGQGDVANARQLHHLNLADQETQAERDSDNAVPVGAIISVAASR
jgi:hypothetical protein